MLRLSRRSFLAGTAAIPFALWFEKYAAAQTPTMTRCEVLTSDGQAMLQKYAQAVATMMSTAEGDPRSWIFQWYTHGVNPASTKDAEIARIYAGNPGANGALAGEMWNTCQAHDPSQDENFFLPWHRMFVYFFERIIRSVLGDSTFALPYWNYSTPVTSAHGILPPQFRQQGDATFGSLFRPNRNPGTNQGNAIDQDSPNALDLDALMGETTYDQQSDAVQGFCMDLDFNLHGSVHVMVGDAKGMGSIPSAANDPIFWLHHCNVDRLWASWNQNGGKNLSGSWLTQQFIFADENGNRVAATVQDFLDLGRLGYTYDSFEPAPPGFAPPPIFGAAPPPPAVATRVSNAVPLAAGPVQVPLEPTTPFGAAATEAMPANKRLYLVMKNLKAQAAPGVVYRIYLNLPPNASLTDAHDHQVGTLNFFAALGHAGHGGSPSAGAKARFFSTEITKVARRLRERGQLSGKPIVTIVPAGQPAASAQPVVGQISLVAR